MLARLAIIAALAACIAAQAWSAQVEEPLKTALELHESGKLKEAIAVYDKVIKSHPKLAEAYFNRGNAYYDLGENQQAVRDYGQAITYLLNHWARLTLFLRQPGAPLDNNLCERALKKAILHRKNALFYKTSNGAHVGDLFMSLIHTCELEGVNPFQYLTALQHHPDAVAVHPTAWLPWNYQDALAAAPATAAR